MKSVSILTVEGFPDDGILPESGVTGTRNVSKDPVKEEPLHSAFHEGVRGEEVGKVRGVMIGEEYVGGGHSLSMVR